jgi:uncharacterized membrane protein YphA (DoxX/SURF4 family)
MIPGADFVQSAWGEIRDISKVIGCFASLGIPAPAVQAPFAASTELICGLALLAGLFTRVASVPLVVTEVVAIVTAKRGDIASATDSLVMSECLYVLLLGALAAFGPGPLSLDRLLLTRLEGGTIEDTGPAPSVARAKS